MRLWWAVLVSAALIGAYWYWSPHMVLYEMAKATKNKDADALNEHVDYPKLRESIKGQLSARFANDFGTSSGGDNPFAAAGSALGAMLGMAMVNSMVDAMVRPETVMYAMSHDGRLDPKAAAASRSAGEADAKSAKPKWVVERKGASRFLLYPGEDDLQKAKADKTPSLVFERAGFANWKLTEFRINQ